MVFRVYEYRLSWSVAQGIGIIELKPQEGEVVRLTFDKGDSFSAACSILQNEEPVFFDSDSKSIYCGPEQVN